MKISPLRAVQALYRLARLVRDPDRLDEVFEMSDAIATPEILQAMIDHVSRDPDVVRALAERHRVEVDVAALVSLPEGTLGRTFADHMIANGLDPAALPTLPSQDDHEFFRAHLYETHDIWHVVTGFRTDIVGELGLQAFYLAQIPGALPALLIAVGFLRSGIYDEKLSEPMMEAIVHGWRAGKRAKPLFGVRWDAQWSSPLSEVRTGLGVLEAPTPSPAVVPLAA